MIKEEIIELAKQCSFTRNWEYEKCLVCNPDSLYHFATLIAEKEREDCIKIVMQGTGEPVQRKTLDILHQERTRIALAIKGQK